MADIAQYLGTGKRKTSVARVILRPGDGKTWINGRTLEDYFPRASHRTAALGPFKTAGAEGTYDLRVRVHGGGISGQAGAVRHGIARALVEADPELRVVAEARGLPDARRPPGGAQEGRPAQGAQGAAVLQALDRTRPTAAASLLARRRSDGTTHGSHSLRNRWRSRHRRRDAHPRSRRAARARGDDLGRPRPRLRRP